MSRLTDRDLLILEKLTDDCGHPLWELSENIAWDKSPEAKSARFELVTDGCGHPSWELSEKSENIACDRSLEVKSVRYEAKNIKGNLLKNLTRLEKLGFVHKLERKSTRPNTRSKNMHEYPYYITKNSNILYEIQDCLLGPIGGRIRYYRYIDTVEQKNLEKLALGRLNNRVNKPNMTDKHFEARGFLSSFIHLYAWCDKVKNEIDEVVEIYNKDSFSLLTLIPPCHLCRKVDRRTKIEQHHREIMQVLLQQDKFPESPIRLTKGGQSFLVIHGLGESIAWKWWGFFENRDILLSLKKNVL